MERINSLLEVYLHHYVDRQEMVEEAKDSLKKAGRCIKKYVDPGGGLLSLMIGIKNLKIAPKFGRRLVARPCNGL